MLRCGRFPTYASAHLGASYTLTPGIAAAARREYERLREFDASPDRPGNVVVAMQRFSSTFDRRGRPTDALIDDMIALEAVVGTKEELALTIAFRISGMLERDPRTRVALFRSLKSFYKTRSRVIHGEQLGHRQHADLGRETELRDIVRRTLRGCLRLVGTPLELNSKFLERGLDDVLLDERQRLALVRAMRSR